MAISTTSNQYTLLDSKPLDSKALVQTYSKLISADTWTVNGKNIAYNGMIIAVWLDKETINGVSQLSSKNGVYFLFDKSVTSTRNSTPDVTNEANWHKLGGIDSLPGLADQISAIQTDLDKVKSEVEELQDSATVVRETKSDFPEVGTTGKIYVATKEATTYVWYNDDYLPVGDGVSGSGEIEIQIIHGGNANG